MSQVTDKKKVCEEKLQDNCLLETSLMLLRYFGSVGLFSICAALGWRVGRQRKASDLPNKGHSSLCLPPRSHGSGGEADVTAALAAGRRSLSVHVSLKGPIVLLSSHHTHTHQCTHTHTAMTTCMYSGCLSFNGNLPGVWKSDFSTVF